MLCNKGITLSFWLNIHRVFSKQKLIVQLWDQQNANNFQWENSNHQVGLFVSVTRKSLLIFLEIEFVTPSFDMWTCRLQVARTVSRQWSMVTLTWERENLRVYINKTLMYASPKILTPSIDSGMAERKGRHLGKSNMVEVKGITFWEQTLSNVDINFLYKEMPEEPVNQQLIDSEYNRLFDIL